MSYAAVGASPYDAKREPIVVSGKTFFAATPEDLARIAAILGTKKFLLSKNTLTPANSTADGTLSWSDWVKAKSQLGFAIFVEMLGSKTIDGSCAEMVAPSAVSALGGNQIIIALPGGIVDAAAISKFIASQPKTLVDVYKPASGCPAPTSTPAKTAVPQITVPDVKTIGEVKLKPYCQSGQKPDEARCVCNDPMRLDASGRCQSPGRAGDGPLTQNPFFWIGFAVAATAIYFMVRKG